MNPNSENLALEQFLQTPIEFLKGVGPARAELLRKELNIHSYGDLLFDFPFRHIDRSEINRIADIRPDQENVQLLGILEELKPITSGKRKRLQAFFRDNTGTIELVWFQGIRFIEKQLMPGMSYLIFGKVNSFKGKISLVHPEMELVDAGSPMPRKGLQPVYSSTEKLTRKGLDTKGRRKLLENLFEKLAGLSFSETLPAYLLEKTRLVSRDFALRHIHFPEDQQQLNEAIKRLKFEELFFAQLRLLFKKAVQKKTVKGYPFSIVGDQFLTFYKNHLPFELTEAQKRVIKEIRADLGKQSQMNRLLQGDVGSGKTVVALMSLLIAIDNGFQGVMMAPTEILAQQHFNGITELLGEMEIEVALLTGSVKGKARKEILQRLKDGDLHILVGTHAILEDPVVFKSLGLAVIDEQHRFGVAQRARLWNKAKPHPPHILVMTATPIPRTLAMSFYGDLDISVIDELPPGRKPVETVHFYESQRSQVISFMKSQIGKGRQIYVVYPLIEESETLDLANLQTGFDQLLPHFPRPDYQISIVHGRMSAGDKDFEMERFVKGKTHIMVATTVIEVGVNVPNASVMVIENTERFGLSQLHQLRGRVGRGADQSYCILMSGYKLTEDARHRIRTMCNTNNGFVIAEEDLKLRGPGEIEGTRQSGALSFKLANLVKDGPILTTARNLAARILSHDPDLSMPDNASLRRHIEEFQKTHGAWSQIS